MNSTSGEQKEPLSIGAVAVGKNVFVAVLCFAINYINATIVHTFNKHHVRLSVLSQVKNGPL